MTDVKPLCIYHGNCADGFTAAWAVWKRDLDRAIAARAADQDGAVIAIVREDA